MKQIFKFCIGFLILLNFCLAGNQAVFAHVEHSLDYTIIENSKPLQDQKSQIPSGLPEEKRESKEKIEDSVERIEKDTQLEFFTFIRQIFFTEFYFKQPTLNQYFHPEGFTIVHSTFVHIWICCFLN